MNKISKAKSKGGTKFVIQFTVMHIPGTGMLSSHRLNELIYARFNNVRWAICKSVEVEIQGERDALARAFIAFDNVALSVTTTECLGSLFVQRSRKILNYPKMCSGVGLTPYFIALDKTITPCVISVVSSTQISIRLKFRGYLRNRTYTNGVGLNELYYKPQNP